MVACLDLWGRISTFYISHLTRKGGTHLNSEVAIPYRQDLIEPLFFYLSRLLKKPLDIIGIGTQSPQSKLNVLGTIHAGTDGDEWFRVTGSHLNILHFVLTQKEAPSLEL